jgi:hypothetical protein
VEGKYTVHLVSESSSTALLEVSKMPLNTLKSMVMIPCHGLHAQGQYSTIAGRLTYLSG